MKQATKVYILKFYIYKKISLYMRNKYFILKFAFYYNFLKKQKNLIYSLKNLYITHKTHPTYFSTISLYPFQSSGLLYPFFSIISSIALQGPSFSFKINALFNNSPASSQHPCR